MDSEEEETIDELLKDLRESSNQNKLAKNVRLYKKQVVKSKENLITNNDEIIPKSLLPTILNDSHKISNKLIQNIDLETIENSKGAFKKFMSKAEIKPLNEKLFYNFAFILIPDRNEMTDIRVKVINQQIIKRKGSTFNFSGSVLDFPNFIYENTNKIKIVICSKNNLFENCEKFCWKFQCDLRNSEFPIIDFEWICECLKSNELMDPNIYRLFRQFTDNKRMNFSNLALGGDNNMLIGEDSTKNKEISFEKPIMEIEKMESSKIIDNSNKNNKQNIVTNKKTNEIINNLTERDIVNENDKILKKSSSSSTISKTITDPDSETLEEMKLNTMEFTKPMRCISTSKMLQLFDYSYESESETSSIDIKKEEPFLVFSEYEEDSDIEYMGSNKQLKKEEKESLFEGIELNENAKLKFKEFKYDNPGQKKRSKFWDSKKENFFCATGIAKENYNSFITDELEKLLKIYTNEKDKGRMHAYRKAISMIKAQKKTIESIRDVEKLPSIGEKIKAKILEILETGQLRKAINLQNDQKNKTIEILSGVWGIGPTTAERFYYKGIKTIEDLRANENLLNSNQKIGLKYYEDLKQRIPRNEVVEVCNIVKQKIEEISDDKNAYDMIPCGSYRRGKETCGDIDILLTRKDGKNFDGFLAKLIKNLEGILLTDHLALPKPGSHQSETYMGIYYLNNKGFHRRIDMKIYPREHFGYAVLYFTGSDYFNRSMRLFSRKKGYTLSDHGLHPAFRFKNQKVWEGENIPCYTEEEVFKVLGLYYRKPEERNV